VTHRSPQVPGAAICPGGPGPSRPARATAVATRGRSSSGIGPAARLASQTAGRSNGKQRPQRDTPIMKILSSRDQFGRRCTRIARAWSGGAGTRERPPYGCTAQEATGVNGMHVRADENLGGDAGRPCLNHGALPGAPDRQ
jgi:hypothetical protein